MKIPTVCHDRLSTTCAGELVGQFLGNLCLQVAVMDRNHPAVEAGLLESHIATREQQQEEASCISTSSDDTLVGDCNPLSERLSKSSLPHESVRFFHATSDHVDVPENRIEVPASTTSLSSCTEVSEIEVRSAEVNPVTFQVMPPSFDNGQRSNTEADLRSTREHQAESVLSDYVNSTSDGVSSCSAARLSVCYSGGPPSPATHSAVLDRVVHRPDEAGCSRVKLMCSFGGHIVSRQVDGKLRYVGGETRILAVNRTIKYNEFMAKMAQLHGAPLKLKYQLPDEHLDALISISSSDDLQNMFEEYDKLELSGGVNRLRLFFFTSPVEHETTRRGTRMETEDRRYRPEQRHVNAINSVQEKLFDNQQEDDEMRLRQLDEADHSGLRVLPDDSSTAPAWYASPVKASLRVPSTLSSPPLTPSQAHLKPLRIGDSSFQTSRDRRDTNTIKYELMYPSRVDYHYRKISDLSSRIPVSGGESWRNQAGMRRVNSQPRLMRLSEQQPNYGTVSGFKDVQSDLPLPAAEHQRLAYQHLNYIPQQQPTPMEVKGAGAETMQHHPSDVHKQAQLFRQPRETVHQVHQPAQFCTCRTVADNDGRSRDTEFQGELSPLHRSLYQMGAAPSSPRMTHDCSGWCSCAQQPSQVHRGINVCLNDQTYSRRAALVGDFPSNKYGVPPYLGERPSRKHGFPEPSGPCDSPSHSGEHLTWLQHASQLTCPDADIGNAWRHDHDRHVAQCCAAECETKSRGPQQWGPLWHTEALLSSHDQCEMNKTRCLCSPCCDGGQEPVFVPIYTGLQGQAGGRFSTHEVPLYNWRGGKESEEVSGAEWELARKNAEGDFNSKRLLAKPVPYHGDLTMRMLPAIPRFVPEDLQISEPSTTSCQMDANQPLKLGTLKPSVGSNRSIKPRVWTGTPPCATSDASGRLAEEDFIKTSYSQGMPTIDGPSGLEERSTRKALHEGNVNEVQGCMATESILRDDTDRGNAANQVIGEAAAEWLPVASSAKSKLAIGCKTGQIAPIEGTAHLFSQNVISVGSLAPLNVLSSSVQQVFPPGASTMNPSKVLKSPPRDQSPSSTTNSTGVYLEPSYATPMKGQANIDTQITMSSMSITGLLADGTVSSVPSPYSNKECCDEARLADFEVGDMNLKEIKENKVEPDTKSVMGTVNLDAPSIKKGKEHAECSEAANKLLKVSVENEQLPGTVPVLYNDMMNKSASKEKGVAAGTVCVQSNGMALRQPEAEARARGLQVIRNADLEDLTELGSGTFGTVFHGKWRGSDVAIKRIKMSCFMGRPSEQERLIFDFWKEAHTLSQLHHPNIVTFYGLVPDGPEGALATVTEYLVNGSLKKVLRKKDRTIDRRKRLIIAMGAAFGMEYLHTKNIVHFDLKCDNLLVNMKDAQRPICKVGDFGLSKVKHRTMVSGGVRGTIPWMAPELLSGNSSMVTEKIDVFSFGIVMWELLTGEEPYARMHNGDIIGGIVKNTLRPSIPSWCEPGWRALMERCWSGDPVDRPSFSEIATELRALAASMNVR